MLHTIKTVRTYSPASFPRSLPSSLRRETSALRFSAHPDSDHKMDKSQNPSEEVEATGNLMSHSFGEGYASRCDEEGFGGMYVGNQSAPKTDKFIHENHPDYDKTQGSEVKEKEKARHQSSSNG